MCDDSHRQQLPLTDVKSLRYHRRNQNINRTQRPTNEIKWRKKIPNAHSVVSSLDRKINKNRLVQLLFSVHACVSVSFVNTASQLNSDPFSIDSNDEARCVYFSHFFSVSISKNNLNNFVLVGSLHVHIPFSMINCVCVCAVRGAFRPFQRFDDDENKNRNRINWSTHRTWNFMLVHVLSGAIYMETSHAQRISSFATVSRFVTIELCVLYFRA